MPPKPIPKAGKKGPPAAALAIKQRLALQKAAEEREKQAQKEEEERLREEMRIAEEQRKYEEKQERLAQEAKKQEKQLHNKEKKKQGPSAERLSRLLGDNYILPDTERIRQEQALEEKEKASKPKAKPSRPPIPPPQTTQEEEEDTRDEWEIEADKEAEELAKKTEKADAVDAPDDKAGSGVAPGSMRSPICCVLGHVDTGKTSLLDRIRKTDVQSREAGGITQQIGATFFPRDALVNATAELNKSFGYSMDVPGLLVIDTPGHESFSNLRSRGSSLCDIAILIVDLMHGIEPQTIESIELLKSHRCPFIIAANKVDRCYDWQRHDNMDFQQTLSLQKGYTQDEFQTRWMNVQKELLEHKVYSELYYKNTNLKGCVSVVPTSAVTGEGISDLLLLMINLVQLFMANKVTLKASLQCTVLEVKPVDGIGTTIDAILVNGELREKETIVLAGINGPIKTQIRALLTPQPLKELRVKSDYVHHQYIQAAMGIKIAADGMETVIPGTSLKVLGPTDNYDEVAKEVQADVSCIMSKANRSAVGVCVQSSTLGSLEALLGFLDQMKIPISAIALGPIHKRHMHQAISMKERNPKFGVMLAFDVAITPDARNLADEHGIQIFSANIIYHLFDQFKMYCDNYDKNELERQRKIAVFPCVLKISQCFHASDPMILGCEVLRGNLFTGTPLCIIKNSKVTFIGNAMQLQRESKDIPVCKRGDSCAVLIHNPEALNTAYGRHVTDNYELLSKVTRQSVEAVKHFRNELDQDSINLLRDLVKIQGIPPPPPKTTPAVEKPAESSQND